MRLAPWLFVACLLFVGVAVPQAQQVYRPGEGVSLPKVVSEVRPEYTPEAKAAGVEGTVALNAVVLADGTVGDVSVAKSLDAVYRLDNQAIAALRRWTFVPGRKDGEAVAVRVFVEMTFTLK